MSIFTTIRTRVCSWQSTRRRHRKEKELSPSGDRYAVRAVGALTGVLILFLSIATSEQYATPRAHAEMLVQNVMEYGARVTEGVLMLAYEVRSEDVIDTSATFGQGIYTVDGFEVGDDLRDAGDALQLGHYGDNPPDVSEIDWWDDDDDPSTLYGWRYRQCFTIDNTASTDALEEYQIYLDFDTARLIADGKMRSDGYDVRFVTADGDVLAHYIANDLDTASTRMWVRVDDVFAGAEEEICLYYGNPGASDVGDRAAVFSSSAARPIYYVVADTAESTSADIVSYADGNAVSVSTYSDTLDRTDAAQAPSASVTLTQTTAISTTHPVSGTYNANSIDNIVPASFAGQAFVYRMDRYTNAFSFVSPWCDADVEVRNEHDTIVTGGTFTVTAGGSHNLTTTDNATTGISNDSAVIIDVTNGCDILVQHHGTTGGDSYALHPHAREWYGVGSGSFHLAAYADGTSVTVHRSVGTSVSYTLNRGDNVMINDAGSQGTDPAFRVVASSGVGVMALGDGDGGDAHTFLPREAMGQRYYIPDDTQYVAIATRAGLTTTVDLYHDATTCGTGAPDDTATVTAGADAPGKVYFGATSAGNHIPAGSCVLADHPITLYNEYNFFGDEHNVWNERQNRQFVSPAPTSVIGALEEGRWELGAADGAWLRRLPVTVTNTSGTALTEYQVVLDLSAAPQDLYDLAQSDGGDLRVGDALGSPSGDHPYLLDAYDATDARGTLFVRVPTIAAGGTAEFYIYFKYIDETVTAGAHDPILWVDAMDIAGDGSATADGAVISQWHDKSPEDNDLIQYGSNPLPQKQTDTVGPVVAFSADRLVTENNLFPSGTDDVTYFLMMRTRTVTSGFLMHTRGTRFSTHIPWSNGNWYSDFRCCGAGRLYTAWGGNTTDFFRWTGRHSVTGGKELRRDGTTIASTTAGADGVAGALEMVVGGSASGYYNHQEANIAEMIVFDADLSTAEMDALESYLAEKWGAVRTSASLTTTGDASQVFATTTPKPNYFVVDENAVGEQLSLIASVDGTILSDGAATETVQEGEIVTFPFAGVLRQDDAFSVRAPLQIGFADDTVDAALPISFAGTEFVAHVGRDSDVFSVYAPFADATVEIYESTASGWVVQQTTSVTEGAAATIAEDIANGRAVRVVASEPILLFHRNGTNDSKIMYPATETYDEGDDAYVLYGVGTGSVMLASTGDATATLYRSDGTETTITLNASNFYRYTEGGGGAQGTARGYRIVSDAPIGASSYADSDGGEAVTFLPQREMSDEYIVSQPVQYMSIVTRDPGVTCRVYDASGAEITSGPSMMDNTPPQTGGTQILPHPNRIHIGGDDSSDGAFFVAGSRLSCDAPVYAYYEHHRSSLISDETSWLTWPQGRTRNHVEPTIDDIDDATEEGLYFESGFDAAGAGTIAEAQAVYTFDTSALLYGEHTYWRDLQWEHITADRGDANALDQVTLEVAYADAVPTCALATYSAYADLVDVVTLSAATDTTPEHYDQTHVTERGLLPDAMSDHPCVRVRVTLRTGDPIVTPRVPEVRLGYYVPGELESQLLAPAIDVDGATGTGARQYRVLKAVTSDTGLSDSDVSLSYFGVSDASVFASADFDLYSPATQSTTTQFAFPPFPSGVPVHATDEAAFESGESVAVYFSHQRSTGSIETISLSLDVDVAGAGGPIVTRDFTLHVSGI